MSIPTEPEPDLRHLASPALRDLVRIAAEPDFDARLTQIDRLAGCTRPIRLRPNSTSIDGSSASQPVDHRLLIACGNRRASCCPSCSAVYTADTYQLIRAGLSGGKNVPDTVTTHPRVFATLTAPSFGPVHRTGTDTRCHCGIRHDDADPQLGTPLAPESYDYQGAVLFNAHAGRLWAYFTTNLRRSLARTAGRPPSWLREELTLAFAKVTEYQKRGLIHFHAIIRLDGPDGPASPPPPWASVPGLCDAITHAATNVAVHAEEPELPTRVLRFGAQLDIQNITAAGQDLGPVTETAVASYIAKYATKTASSTGALDRPVHCPRCRGHGHTASATRRPRICRSCHGLGLARPLDTLGLDAHTRRMVETCWDLGGYPALADLKLRRWAHTLGYRGPHHQIPALLHHPHRPPRCPPTLAHRPAPKRRRRPTG
ncbi:replication initiator [Streptomyces sp. NPDC007861]|uniref:replication initiator n=1 Tax=Streptomyces sp. NPDC007861 TaxID=3154893 RepID=UPI0033C14204